MAVTNTSHGFPAVRAENGSSFTSAPSHGFHVDTAAFSDGWPDGRFWTQIGSTFDPNPYGMVMQTQRASTKSRTLRNTLSKNPTGRSKDSPIGYKRGTAWSKDSPVRYKKVLVGRRLSSRVENRDRTVAFGPNARELQPRRKRR